MTELKFPPHVKASRCPECEAKGFWFCELCLKCPDGEMHVLRPFVGGASGVSKLQLACSNCNYLSEHTPVLPQPR
jgi:hypothetical protein